ncbi:hypothetical protein [Pseudomonas triticifolii]|uniref:Uncharacterized protein n=1 Tax=Pseudomonas triticifolii TaxID=2762592 RepID=A0ABR7BA06_9PSED|nr:hypothetical protein [Pseudomonas triticifolii]MBC3953998.1 hypothetical protein [Pseudomonas triticifolii]
MKNLDRDQKDPVKVMRRDDRRIEENYPSAFAPYAQPALPYTKRLLF